MDDKITLENIKQKKDKIKESIDLLSSIKMELTSDESSPLITKISDFLEVANNDPEIIEITNEIKNKEETLKILEEEARKYDKKTKEAQSLQQFYFSLIQKQFPEAISK